MRKILQLLCMFLLSFLFSIAYAAPNATFAIQSNSGTTAGDTILGLLVSLNYTTVGGTPRRATSDVADMTVATIFGFDPRWETRTTVGVEPFTGLASQVATYQYSIRNVGNDAGFFRIATSCAYVLSSAADWTVRLSTWNLYLTEEEDTDLDYIELSVYGRSAILPGAQVIVSLGITCVASPTSNPYTGDNSASYGGYGYRWQHTTTSIEIARMAVTKNVIIDSPAGYQAQGGAVDAAVPGSLLTYTIIWKNIGSIPATQVEFTDYLPNTWVALRNTVSTESTGVPVNVGTINYVVGGVEQAAYNANASQLLVGYSIIPVGATGTINYEVVIR